jgi:hypothetical protein
LSTATLVSAGLTAGGLGAALDGARWGRRFERAPPRSLLALVETVACLPLDDPPSDVRATTSTAATTITPPAISAIALPGERLAA